MPKAGFEAPFRIRRGTLFHLPALAGITAPVPADRCWRFEVIGDMATSTEYSVQKPSPGPVQLTKDPEALMARILRHEVITAHIGAVPPAALDTFRSGGQDEPAFQPWLVADQSEWRGGGQQPQRAWQAR